MKTARIERKPKTSGYKWISFQELAGIYDVSLDRIEFHLHYDPVDEEVWKLDARDHNVRFTPVQEAAS